MIHFEAIYDISVSLGQEDITYPGDTSFSRKIICEVNDGSMSCTSRLVMSAHTGTHLDTPAHFFAEARNLDQYIAKDFILPAQVVEIKGDKPITPLELESVKIMPGDAILFKTENSRSGKCTAGVFSNHFVYLTQKAADLCTAKKPSLIGIDYISVDRFNDENFPVHRTLLENNILILESINLKQVPPGRYTLVCLPLKIKGSEASPVRAVLLR